MSDTPGSPPTEPSLVPARIEPPPRLLVDDSTGETFLEVVSDDGEVTAYALDTAPVDVMWRWLDAFRTAVGTAYRMRDAVNSAVVRRADQALTRTLRDEESGLTLKVSGPDGDWNVEQVKRVLSDAVNAGVITTDGYRQVVRTKEVVDGRAANAALRALPVEYATRLAGCRASATSRSVTLERP